METIGERLISAGPIPSPSHLDLAQLFGRTAPIQVDLGCGDGFFLFQMAGLYPEKNFLGVERLARRATKTGRKATRLKNMQVLRVETLHALQFLLPPLSVETFYLLFPDPWPKRRHHRRRIVTAKFLQGIHRALEPDGILRIATDHPDYFARIQTVVSAGAPAFPSSAELDQFDLSGFPQFKIMDDQEELPPTRFEQRFRAAGLPIYRLSLRKISPET